MSYSPSAVRNAASKTIESMFILPQQTSDYYSFGSISSNSYYKIKLQSEDSGIVEIEILGKEIVSVNSCNLSNNFTVGLYEGNDGAYILFEKGFEPSEKEVIIHVEYTFDPFNFYLNAEPLTTLTLDSKIDTSERDENDNTIIYRDRYVCKKDCYANQYYIYKKVEVTTQISQYLRINEITAGSIDVDTLKIGSWTFAKNPTGDELLVTLGANNE